MAGGTTRKARTRASSTCSQVGKGTQRDRQPWPHEFNPCYLPFVPPEARFVIAGSIF